MNGIRGKTEWWRFQQGSQFLHIINNSNFLETVIDALKKL